VPSVLERDSAVTVMICRASCVAKPSGRDTACGVCAGV
jgi:hypothetical protein